MNCLPLLSKGKRTARQTRRVALSRVRWGHLPGAQGRTGGDHMRLSWLSTRLCWCFQPDCSFGFRLRKEQAVHVREWEVGFCRPQGPGTKREKSGWWGKQSPQCHLCKRVVVAPYLTSSWFGSVPQNFPLGYTHLCPCWPSWQAQVPAEGGNTLSLVFLIPEPLLTLRGLSSLPISQREPAAAAQSCCGGQALPQVWGLPLRLAGGELFAPKGKPAPSSHFAPCCHLARAAFPAPALHPRTYDAREQGLPGAALPHTAVPSFRNE